MDHLETNPSSSFVYPHKSVAVALIFCVLLGPVGLLYASCFGGIVMIIIGMIVWSSHLVFPMILVWLISCVWGVWVVESCYYTQRILISDAASAQTNQVDNKAAS